MERKPYRKPLASGGKTNLSGVSRRMNTSGARPTSSVRAPQSQRGAQSNRNSSSTRTAQARYAASTAQQRNAAASRHSTPNRRRRDPISIILPILMALAALAGVVYVGSSWFIATINRSTYCSNIYINGIEVTAYSREEGEAFVREKIDARLNTSYSLTWQGNNWSFTAADFNGSIALDSIMDRAWNIGHVGNIFDRSAAIRSLKQNPIYLEASLNCDEALIEAYVDQIYDQLYIAPVDAMVAADTNNPYIVAGSSSGQELDKETTIAQITSLLETGEGGTVLPVLPLEPKLSTEDALNSLELIVTYKTDTTARGYNSRFNVRKALSYFNGMIVQPGEEISFNTVVGPRTGERGWQVGTEYIGGGKTQESYGGGICQASTTLYGALIKAGITVMDRSPHSMTVAYVEPSIDAAVTETGSKDLIFRNDTENPFTIYTEVTKEYAMVQIYGVRPPYRYEMESHVISEDTTAVRVSFIQDLGGTHCYYNDEVELYKKGRAACESEAWLVSYDWETGEEVSRSPISRDKYQSGTDIYWVGVHSRDEGIVAPSATTSSLENTGAAEMDANFGVN